MTDIGTAVAEEATKGILERVPADAIPYVLLVFVTLAICLFSIYMAYRTTTKNFEKALEENRKSYDNTIKSQQETINTLVKQLGERREEK